MKRIVLALLLLAVPAAARAQTQAPAAPEPSAAQIAAAREVLLAMNMEENFRKNMESGMLSQMYAGLPRAQADSMIAVVRRIMPWNELEPRFARMYAQLFTEGELHQLAAFYRSPVGRKTVEVTPEMTERSLRISQEQMQSHMAEFMAAMQATMPSPRSSAPPGKKP